MKSGEVRAGAAYVLARILDFLEFGVVAGRIRQRPLASFVQCRQQLLDPKGLEDEIGSTGAQCGDRRLQIRVSSHEDDRCVLVLLAQLGDPVDP